VGPAQAAGDRPVRGAGRPGSAARRFSPLASFAVMVTEMPAANRPYSIGGARFIVWKSIERSSWPIRGSVMKKVRARSLTGLWPTRIR